MENGPFEDVFPIENGDCPCFMLVFVGRYVDAWDDIQQRKFEAGCSGALSLPLTNPWITYDHLGS